MSTPHSVVHSRNYVGDDEGDAKKNGSSKKGKDGKDEGKSGPMASFMKLRRRLTVTGATETIDGVSKLSVSDEGKLHKHNQHRRTSLKCAVTEYCGVTKKGHAPYNPRKKNQDALIMLDDPTTNSLILCVLDGHGEHGDAVSGHFRDNLATEMLKHPTWATDLKKASRDSILKVEHQVFRNFRIDTEFSGTTLSMAIVRDNTVTGVNIGDSRVILGKEENGSIVAEEITHDHKPDTPGEKERIIATGGRVFAVEYDDGVDGPPRVWLGHMDVPGLAMSRSLGDAVAHTAGVISEPEFTERKLTPTDKFLVIATDGLWEFIDNEETVAMVVNGGDPKTAVDVLVKEANVRWIREEQVIDDTTVIVADLYDFTANKK